MENRSLRIYGTATAIVATIILGLTGSGVTQAEDLKSFKDVDVGSPYFVQLAYLKKNGIVKGYGDDNFRPNQEINRAEASMLIQKALINFDDTAPATTQSATPVTTALSVQITTPLTFSDLSDGHWAYQSIATLVTSKIIDGTAKKFRPGETVTLAEAVKMTIVAETLRNPKLTLPTDKKSTFKDIKGTEWFAPYIELANTKTLLSYSTKMLINPGAKMTRGAFADLVYRAIRTRQPGHFFGRGTFYSDTLNGHGTASGEKYDMNALTAAHKTLPFGTNIKVTYLRNNQSVVVRVNDRGPFTPSLDIDMSRKAFVTLASPTEGLISVEYEIVANPTVDEPINLDHLTTPTPVTSEAMTSEASPQ